MNPTGETHPPASLPKPAIAGASGHNLALDGVRGMAILLVMWHHMTMLRPTNAAMHLYQSAAELGSVGVDLFFVLSGFLITGILYDSKQALVSPPVASPYRAMTQPTTAKNPAATFFGNFYARRTLRIFPLYYAMVAFCLLLLPHLAELLRHVVNPEKADLIASKLNHFEGIGGYEKWFWLYLSNFPIGYAGTWLHSILGVSWSLAIEEQFYLVWPMLVWFLSRKNAIRVCCGLIVLALACRCGLALEMIHEGRGYGPLPADGKVLHWANPIGIYVLSFCRVDDLALGALAALLLRGSIDIARATRIARRLVLACGAGAITLVVIDNTMGWATPEIAGAGGGPLYQTLGYTLGGLTCLGGLILAVASRPGGLWHRFWTSWFMRTLGKYAYALYLFHLPIRAAIRDVIFGPGSDTPGAHGPRWTFESLTHSQLLGQFLFYIIAIGASLAAAWVSWVAFESQILKLKKFFPSGVEAKGK
jgi:peptidoglycan/LPS O-acetylase OafA/YrhL